MEEESLRQVFQNTFHPSGTGRPADQEVAVVSREICHSQLLREGSQCSLQGLEHHGKHRGQQEAPGAGGRGRKETVWPLSDGAGRHRVDEFG